MTPRHCSALHCEAESWRACRMVGRELKRWQPSADDAPLEGLEGPHAGGSGGAWDQFAVNRGKFGVQTTFQVCGANSSLLRIKPDGRGTACRAPLGQRQRATVAADYGARMHVHAADVLSTACSSGIAARAAAACALNVQCFLLQPGVLWPAPLYICRPIR